MSSRTAGVNEGDGDGAGKVSIEFRVSPEMKAEVGELIDVNDETFRDISKVTRILVAYALSNADEAAEYGEENDVSL